MRTALELCGGQGSVRLAAELAAKLATTPQFLVDVAKQYRLRAPELSTDQIAMLAYDPAFDYKGKLPLINTLLGLLAIPLEKVIWPEAELTPEERNFWLAQLRESANPKSPKPAPPKGFMAGAGGKLPEEFVMKVLIARAALTELCGDTPVAEPSPCI